MINPHTELLVAGLVEVAILQELTGERGAEHPINSPLSKPTYEKMLNDERFISGEWTEEKWLWEEIKQLNAALRIFGIKVDEV